MRGEEEEIMYVDKQWSSPVHGQWNSFDEFKYVRTVGIRRFVCGGCGLEDELVDFVEITLQIELENISLKIAMANETRISGYT